MAWLGCSGFDHRSGNSYHWRMKAVLSEKGQITIPKRLRDRLGLRAGSVLEFDEEQGRLVARKVTTGDELEALYGSLDLGQSTDELIAELRGEPDAV